MTVSDMVALLTEAQKQGLVLLRDDATNGKTTVAKSVSIRIDDDGKVFVIVHSLRAGDLPSVKAEAET